MVKVQDVVGQLSPVIADEKALRATKAILWLVVIGVLALLGTGLLVAFCGWAYPAIEHWLVWSSAGI